MKRHALIALILFYLMSLTGMPMAAAAEMENNKAFMTLVMEVAPAKNAQDIARLVDQQTSQVKKAAFPLNDKVYKKLMSYAADAMTNSGFNLAYKTAIRKLPSDARADNAWLEKFEYSTTTPNEYYETPQGGVVSLSACEPHNCPTNLKLVYEPKKRKLWGVLHDEAKKKNYLVGEPSNEQLAVLMIILGDGINQLVNTNEK